VPILEAPLRAPAMGKHADDPDLSEYLVKVRWLRTVSEENAVWEAGMFANQNTACRLQGDKGEFTIQRLTERFGLDAEG
jgi:hypothetical protein